MLGCGQLHRETRLAQPASRRMLLSTISGHSRCGETDSVEQASRVATPEKLTQAIQCISQSSGEILGVGLQPTGEFGRFVAVSPVSAAAIRTTGSDCSKLLPRQGEGQMDNLSLTTAEPVEDEVEDVARLVTTAHRGTGIPSLDKRLEETMAECHVLLVDRREQRLFGIWFVGGEAIRQSGGFIGICPVIGLIEGYRGLARCQDGPETPRVDPEVPCCLIEREILVVLQETVVGRDNLSIAVRNRGRRSD